MQVNQQNIDAHCVGIPYRVYTFIFAQKTTDHWCGTCTSIYESAFVASAFVIIGRKCNEVFALVNEWHCTSDHVCKSVYPWERVSEIQSIKDVIMYVIRSRLMWCPTTAPRLVGPQPCVSGNYCV